MGVFWEISQQQISMAVRQSTDPFINIQTIGLEQYCYICVCIFLNNKSRMIINHLMIILLPYRTFYAASIEFHLKLNSY